MASFNFTVDTSPMAAEIGEVSNHVNGTTLAVVAMETAVINAENQAANEVCDNVNRGFHQLIRSHFSQKKTLVQATASSRVLELRRFAISLRKVREQLNADFERITSRYARLFRNLDETLTARIYKLDVEASNLSDQQQTKISLRTSNVGAPTIVFHSETREAADWLLAARMKKGAYNVMTGIGEFIQKGTALKTSVSEMMDPTKATALTLVYTPAILIETDDVYMPQTKATQSFIGNVGSLRNTELIRQKIDENHASLNWQEPAQQEVETVKRICHQKFVSTTNPRMAKIMGTLLERASWKTIQGAS